jgi:UDP-glucose 4-epimerase
LLQAISAINVRFRENIIILIFGEPMKTILIAGGAGYIGSHVNHYLLKHGYETVIVDNLSTGHSQFLNGTHNYVLNLSDTDELEQIFAHHAIDCVMHFAANIVVPESVSDPGKYYNNNVFGLISLLEAMRKHDVKHIVFSSTAAIFGNPETIPIAEDAPQKPLNPYGWSKWMCERILWDYETAWDIHSVAFRYFNACGRASGTDLKELHDPETHLIPIILEVMNGKREKLMIYGDDYDTPDGTCIRDYVHVLDLAQAHEKALRFLEENQKSERFNLGNGSGHSVNEVLKAVESVFQCEIPHEITKRRAGDGDRLVADSRKAKSILGWEPVYSSIESIIETLKN